MIEDYSAQDGNETECQCGNFGSIDEGKWIKKKQHSFMYSVVILKGRRNTK